MDKYFQQTESLLSYLIWFLAEICRYALTDARIRASKLLPTAEDLAVSTKIAENESLTKLLNDPQLRRFFQKWKPEKIFEADKILNTELIRKLYHELTETGEYKNYCSSEEKKQPQEQEILEFIYDTFMLNHDDFVSHVEEYFPNWNDDAEMLSQILVSCIQKPGQYPFQDMLSEEKRAFAHSLLQTVVEKNEFLQSFIIPKLKNWEPERIALMDMIIMKMGVAEFLFFETIPPKVTLNECIDLAKEYSTAQSGQFVNGILDSIHKDLVAQGKMIKKEYKK
ncbi:MAG: transcription antitermination factor NusB [Chitinophagaceae bacterium]|nr:transcription antitermination factor NusB [Chitinophagaceae bacterium]